MERDQVVSVMAALVAADVYLAAHQQRNMWIAGTRPALTPRAGDDRPSQHR